MTNWPILRSFLSIVNGGTNELSTRRANWDKSSMQSRRQPRAASKGFWEKKLTNEVCFFSKRSKVSRPVAVSRISLEKLPQGIKRTLSGHFISVESTSSSSATWPRPALNSSTGTFVLSNLPMRKPLIVPKCPSWDMWNASDKTLVRRSWSSSTCWCLIRRFAEFISARVVCMLNSTSKKSFQKLW